MEDKRKFIKFSEIENPTYILKTIDKYVDDFDPTENEEIWDVTEKIHGSNVCVTNRYKEGPAFFSRNGHSLPANYQEVMKSYNWKRFFEMNPNIDFVYGEIAGKGIQKGVDYGEKSFYIFDMKDKDGHYLSPTPIFQLLDDELDGYQPFRYSQLVFNMTGTLDDVLEKCFSFIEDDPVSWINPVEGNVIEGFVIRCISRPRLTMNNRFIIKVKHPKFEEKVRASGKKSRKTDTFDYSPVAPYVNENRAQSAMSKFPGYKKSKIGDVLREIVRDVESAMKKDGLKFEKQYNKYINKQMSKIVVEGCDV